MASASWKASHQLTRATNAASGVLGSMNQGCARLQQLSRGRSIGIVSAHTPSAPDWINIKHARSLQYAAERFGLTTVTVLADYLLLQGTLNEAIVFEQSLVIVSKKQQSVADFADFLSALARQLSRSGYVLKPRDRQTLSLVELDRSSSPGIAAVLPAGRWSEQRLPELHAIAANGKMAAMRDYGSFELRFN